MLARARRHRLKKRCHPVSPVIIREGPFGFWEQLNSRAAAFGVRSE